MKHLTLFAVALMASMIGFAQDHDVTFNVNTATIAVGPNGMFIGGGAFFGDAMGHAMSDTDGDGIYTVTVSVPDGFTGNYTILNSPANGGDWGAKENIAGQPCADASNWNDRILGPITGDFEVNTCFGQCTTDGSCGTVTGPVAVTFQVDMSNETVGAAVTMAGTFNGWNEASNPMEDADGDGIYTLTLDCDPGGFEWKYLAGGAWGTEEQFDGSESCTMPPGEFVNRIILVEGTDPIVLDPVCFNSCDPCGGGTPCVDSLQIDTTMMCTQIWAPVCGCNGVTYANDCEAQFYGGVTSWTEGECSTNAMVTFKVDMSEQDVAGPIYVTGNTVDGWCGTCVEMLDTDGDNVYEATVELESGDHEYKFNNGGWDGTETLESEGDSLCTLTTINDDGTFVNRFLSILPGAGNVVLDAVCFESCEECEEVVVPDTEVTFNVDMSEQTVSGAVYISGESIDGWAGASVELTDADGDNVYSVTLELPQGDHEYKYMIGSWDTSEQLDETEDAACTITTGGFTNRFLSITSEDAIDLATVCYESCDACSGIIDNVDETNPLAFNVFPSVTDGVLTVAFPAALEAGANLVVRDLSGRTIRTENLGTGTLRTVVDLGQQADGFYVIRVENGQFAATETVIVQH